MQINKTLLMELNRQSFTKVLNRNFGAQNRRIIS